MSIDLRLHTVTYSEVDANGFIGIQFDSFSDSDEGLDTVETHHTFGSRSRPRDPDGGFGCNVLIGWEGDEAHALAVLADPRWIASLPPEKKGGSTRYGVTANGAKAVSFEQFDGDTGGHTLYVPEFTDGAVSGAYCITVDPTKRTIQLIHPDGFAVMLTKDGIQMRGDASTWFKLGKGVFEIIAASITLRGICTLGADTIGAMPLMPGVASQPTPSVNFSIT
jgi:hypothetical protein